jgi:hypothetical protein
MQKREADIDEPIYHYPAILSGDYYMFDYPFDAPESSNTLIPPVLHSTESRHSISLFDVFDWKAHDHRYDDETSIKPSPTMNDDANEWNNSQWDEEFIDNRTFRQSWNAAQVEKDRSQYKPTSNTEKIPTGIDLSSLMTFFELKQNSDKIRRALVTNFFFIYLSPKIFLLKGYDEFSFDYLFGSSSSDPFDH